MTQGTVIWLTGLSGAGKTTLAKALKGELFQRTRKCEILDGDDIRNILSKDLAFSKEDRGTNLERIAFVAKLLSNNGVWVIVAAISPYREHRNLVRNRLDNYVEVYVKCSIEECERRDIKGLYKKARAGDIKHFTGVDDPYEEPIAPDIICNTESESVSESATKILLALENLNFL